MRKPLRLALTRPTSLYKGGCFPQKDGRRVRVSLLSAVFFNIQKKGTGENPDTFPGAEGETRRVFNPSCSLCEQFILCPFLLCKKMDEEFESLSPFCIIQKKGTGENPDTFPGAEGETRRVFNPSCSLCEQFILCPFLLCKKMDEEFESLSPFCIIQKKGTGENPDTFPGAEGETRRVFNPSCSLCEQFILCPFLLCKKMDEEFESLSPFCIIQKKGTGENPDTFPGAEGETRTLAPVTRPTPLAGAPRHQLEYFCIGSVYDTIRLLKERAENPLSLLSGGESGIRTHGTLPYDGFQDRSVITTSVSLRIRRKL